jgi:pimeloyl-ACP methyl ester carboxylesterase
MTHQQANPGQTARADLSSVVPGYFESSGHQLFGCHHRAAASTPKGGIVICQPAGHEQVWCHRVFRNIAAQLARRGFHVLRFDFAGCGDSSGDIADATIEQWVGDVSAAVSHLERIAGVSRPGVIGLRLGATLAALAGSRRSGPDRLDRMILWEPVMAGAAHLTELARVHAAYEEDTGHTSAVPAGRDADTASAPTGEVLGFVYSEPWRKALAEVDLDRLSAPPASRVLLISNGKSPGDTSLEPRLRTLGSHVEVEHCPDPEVWLAEPYKMIIPRFSTNLILSWFAQK